MNINEVFEAVKNAQASAERAAETGNQEALVILASYIRGLFQSTRIGKTYEAFVPSYLEFLATAPAKAILNSIGNIVWSLEQELASSRVSMGFSAN